MKLSDWIFGPQLIGFLLMLLGITQIYFPFKEIKGLDIPSTASPEKKELMMEEAKRFYPRYLVKMSLVLIPVGFLITVIINIAFTSAEYRKAFSYMFFIICVPIIMLSIIKTNNHLDKKFNNKNEIR